MAYIIKDRYYEKDKVQYEQEVNEADEKLQEILQNYSEINEYDYTKYLDSMSYEELFETYIPELLQSTSTREVSPAQALINHYNYYAMRLGSVEYIHNEIPTYKWWIYFGK